MNLSAILIGVVIFATMLYNKQYENLIGLIYLLFCILLSGYFFIGYEIVDFKIIGNDIRGTSQFVKFLSGWIIMYIPWLLYIYKYKKNEE